MGQHEFSRARPLQASGASAISFLAGGRVPFLGMMALGEGPRLMSIVSVTIVGLAMAGLRGARAARTAMLRPTLRVLSGGAAAMLVTAAIGQFAHLSGL